MAENPRGEPAAGTAAAAPAPPNAQRGAPAGALAGRVADRALVLAARSAPLNAAVQELAALAGGGRGALDLARRRCGGDLLVSPADARLVVAVGLLDLALERACAMRSHPSSGAGGRA